MFTVTSISGKTNSSQLREFTLDSPEDIELLPTQTRKGKNPNTTVDNDYCSTGSKAFVISTSQRFMLNSNGIWCEVVNLTSAGGQIAGKSVQISKIEPIVGGNRITFTYTLDNGTLQNSYLEVMNGEKGDSVASASIDKDGILSFTLTNGEEIIAGKISVEIDSGSIDLENYYTKDEADKKFVSMIELDSFIEEKIDKNAFTASNEEIENLFK